MDRIVDSLRPYVDKYDVFFIDLWGVTHNGVEPFSKTINFFEDLRKLGKILIVVSNGPRLPKETIVRLERLGIDTSLFHEVITSGLLCRMALEQQADPFIQSLKPRFYVIGLENDGSVFENLPSFNRVDTVNEADFLLIIGTTGAHIDETPYRDLLKVAYEKQLKALCANPDWYIFQGTRRLIAAGSIAKAYQNVWQEQAGSPAPMIIYGKPDNAIFDLAKQKAEVLKGEPIDKRRILMLGDSIRTDVKGANTYGIDSALTLVGVHQQDALSEIPALFKQYDSMPTYVLKTEIQ